MKKNIIILNRFLLLVICLLLGTFLTTLQAGKPDVSESGNYQLVHNADPLNFQQQIEVSGQVTDAQTGDPLPGVNIVIQGTTRGTTTDMDGNYTIEAPADATLVFSFVGYQQRTLSVNNQETINVQLQMAVEELERVVKIGYGTQKAANVTGSITSTDIEEVEPSDVSLMQSLHGSVAGLNIGQVDEAGEEPSISIRGVTSLSGTQDPLIVVDDVIYRGNLIDLNPSDIETVDILKDASATAIFGSQASNGVVLITTTKSGSTEQEGPEINFSSQYAFQEPWKELVAQNAEEFMQKIEESDILQSRTEESGYTEPNPDWPPTTNFKTNHEIRAYNAGLSFDWYDYVTQDNPYTMKHNLSIANQSETSRYYASVGYTEQEGYMKGEGYNRLNSRINLSSSITDWFDVDIQSFLTVSDYEPQHYAPFDRYIEPYAHAYVVQDGQLTDELVERPFGNPINPLIQATADVEDKRLNLFGNIAFNIDLPLEGLSYKGNFANNYRNNHHYYFGSFESNFTGGGHKNNSNYYDLISDHILSYTRTFNDIHDVDVTLLYGLEQRNHNYTNASGSNFVKDVLSYNRLQAAASDLQSVSSGGWKESSLYNMGRLVYAFKSKYLLTATIRRDGFSGFSEEYKFGYFPSLSLGWVITDESFFSGPAWLSRLKLRASYGSTGNRTIGRYQTLAKVSGSYGYVSGEGSSIYTQNISSLASPSLKWEKTTGIDVGIDFRLLEGRISGAIDYYNKNTTDLLYDVDIPGMTAFSTFPDNLGKIHNNGVEVEISSVNIQMDDFQWRSDFSFSSNRNEIKTLLGFDVDGDGKEDDLVSEGLFIGESLGAIYDYKVDGLWQMDDDIPPGYEFGSFRVIDLNGDGEWNADDKTILGNRRPAYRFSINNVLKYKNWTFSFFLNSIQGGGDRYLAPDNLYGLGIFNTETHFNRAFPKDLDYWTPTNKDARYQRPNIAGADGIAGNRYASRSFLRVQNVRLSYSFGSAELGKLGLNNLKVFVSSKNLATFTNWHGWDPETGADIDNDSRPVMRSYTFGIDISL